MIDPLELIKAGIHIFKAHQRPRDYILTFAKVKTSILRPITADFHMDIMLARL